MLGRPPKNIPLIEDHPRLARQTLAQADVLHPGRVSYWGWKNIADSLAIRVTGGDGYFVIFDEGLETRVVMHKRWMVCPSCERLCRYVIRRDGWRCRMCCGADYAIRHQLRTMPALSRLAILRRLARLPEHSLKAHELRRRLGRVSREIVLHVRRRAARADRRKRSGA